MLRKSYWFDVAQCFKAKGIAPQEGKFGEK
jgi:hypothetical protein